ncbi:hypothetical protein BC826DRAFT_1104999 [Russula brevipes]|nr:hypothetical protein BC826DRAFT_1104999 [Russula brevipes]
MAETTPRNQSQARRPPHSNHGRRRPAEEAARASSSEIENPAAQTQTDVQQDDGQELDLCWICAEPIKYYAVSECNHRTCHVCALRLRALYKRLDCTFCKELQPTVILTASPDAPFSSYTSEAIPYKDDKLMISFETEEMMQDTLILLRFNCPDSSCDYVATGWNDLKLHVRGIHKRFMCDVCISHKKVFSHEHALYTSPQYFTHLPSAQRRQQKGVPKDQVEGGVHPLCDFCRECFFGDDELYAHMRDSHEECFICKRNEIRDKYFQDYNALEQHFEQAHHLCSNPVCQARKFVVFGSQIDLQAHMVEEHGAEMSSRDKKDARRVNAVFEFQDPSSGSTRRRGGGPSGGGSGGGRERGQHDSQQGDTNETPPQPNRNQAPSPPPPSMDPITAERYTAVFTRLRTLTAHPTSSVAGVKLALRDYTASQSGARDLISTVWNTLDRDLDATASIINLVVDFLEDEEKKTDLLGAWNTFKIERRRELPDVIVPTGASTDYAHIADGRVLSAASARRAAPPRQVQRAVWDRVARAAARGATFPSLPQQQRSQPRSAAPPPAPQAPSARKRGARNTAWSASAAGVGVGAGGGSSNSNDNNTAPVTSQNVKPPSVPAPTPAPPAPALTNSAFPTLPSSVAPRAPPIVSARTSQLQHILGSAPPATSAWAPGRATQDESGVASEAEEAAAPAEVAAAGKKKGKGKQKQTLFMFGSYPSAGAGKQD